MDDGITTEGGLRRWLENKLPEVPSSELDLSNVTVRDKTLVRIGAATEPFLVRVLKGEHSHNPENFVPTLQSLLTCRTHFSNLEAILKLSKTSSLSEAFGRFLLIAPSKEPTGDTIVIGTPGQKNKEGFYQVYNRQDPSAGTLFFGKKAFTHLYELFAGEGVIEEKVKTSKKREKSYDDSLKALLLGETKAERTGVSKDSWLIKERQELLTKLKTEVEVARQILDKLGYVPSGILPQADRALLENEAGGGVLGWLKREKENLPPSAKEALELLLDKFVDLEDEDRAFLLESVFSISQALRYVDRSYALSDIESDIEAYRIERGSLPPSFTPLLRLIESESKIVTHRDLQTIGISGIIDFRRERNEGLLEGYSLELLGVMKELSPLFRVEDGRLFDDVLGKSVPKRIKDHLYFRPLFRGDSLISKDDFLAIRDITEFYKDDKFSWHLTSTYSIEAFEAKVERAILAARRIKYANTFLGELRLSDHPKDPPSETILRFNKELVLGEVKLVREPKNGDEELFRRFDARSDLLPKFLDYTRKINALKAGLRMETFNDEELALFRDSMSSLVTASQFSKELGNTKWLLSRPLVDEDMASELPPLEAKYLSPNEIIKIKAVSDYAERRRRVHPKLQDEASNQTEAELLSKRKELLNSSFIGRRIHENNFKIEKRSLSTLAKTQRYAGFEWRSEVDEISYLDPELLRNSIDRIEEDFIRVEPPYNENSDFAALKRLSNSSGVSRLRALGHTVSSELWRDVPSVKGKVPVYISKSTLKFIHETVEEKSRAVHNHFGVAGERVIFAFSKKYEGKDLFDLVAESRDEIEGFLVWMKKSSFPDESCDVVEKALEVGIKREELYNFAWSKGSKELFESPQKD